MEPKGVRIECPQCHLNTTVTEEVGHDETMLPPKINKRVFASFMCPNCPGDVVMEAVATVDLTPKQTREVIPMTLDQVARKVAALEVDCAAEKSILDNLAERHKDAKKVYDARVLSLRLAASTLGRLLNGETIEDPDRLPLFDDIVEEVHPDTANGLDTLHQQLVERLAAIDIRVTLEDVRNWSTEPHGEGGRSVYDEVVAYVSALEDEAAGTPNEDVLVRPACLPAPVEAVRQTTVTHQKKARRGRPPVPETGAEAQHESAAAV